MHDHCFFRWIFKRSRIFCNLDIFFYETVLPCSRLPSKVHLLSFNFEIYSVAIYVKVFLKIVLIDFLIRQLRLAYFCIKLILLTVGRILATVSVLIILLTTKAFSGIFAERKVIENLLSRYQSQNAAHLT